MEADTQVGKACTLMCMFMGIFTLHSLRLKNEKIERKVIPEYKIVISQITCRLIALERHEIRQSHNHALSAQASDIITT